MEPAVQHDMMDAVAWARTFEGFRGHFENNHVEPIRKLLYKTQKNIKASMKNTMEFSGYKDWSRHYTEVQKIIEESIEQLRTIAFDGVPFNKNAGENSLGIWPDGKMNYGRDFLFSLLIPDSQSMADNTVHYNPVTREFLPAYKNINKSVVDAVFLTMKNYKVLPDYASTMRDIAGLHRANYETLMVGDNFGQSLRKLNENTFEGALLSHTIDNVLHDPFMSRKKYKTISENDQTFSRIGSEYAELFRRMLQGDMTDPSTAARLGLRVRESHGQEAYDNLFNRATNEVVFDGTSSKLVGVGKGNGILLGELVNPRAYQTMYKTPKVTKRLPKHSLVRSAVEERIGNQNYKDNQRGKCE